MKVTKRATRIAMAAIAVIVLVGAVVSCAPPAVPTGAGGYNTLVHWSDQGNKIVVESGGEIEVLTGGLVDFQSGSMLGESIGFEGATADAFETTLSVTDPTAARAIVLPNASGTVALNPAAGSIEFEGTTADAFEGTLAVVDPTADRTYTIPDETGAVVMSSLATNGTDIANSVTGGTNQWIFEGATADAFEGWLTPVDPTADRTWTIPNESGAIVMSSLATNGTDVANSVSGGTNQWIFEGATADASETIVTPTDATADRTQTLPDLTGTFLLQQGLPTAGASGDFLDITATDSASDGTDVTIGLDMNLTGAAATGTGNKLYGVDLDLTTADAQQTEVALMVDDATWDYAIDAGDVPTILTAQTWFLDFLGDTVPAEIVEVSGSDGQALQAMAAEQFGVYQLTSGDDGTSVATDGEGFSGGLMWQADQGSLVFQARLHIDAIANAIVFLGFTDSAGLEMPVTVGVGTDTPASVADDFVGFVYDSGSTTDNWFVSSAAATVAGTGVDVVAGSGPANGVYEVFRIEVDAAGGDVRFYIDSVEVGTCTAGCITITDLLTPMIIVDTNAAASSVVDLDYVYASAQRN